MEVENINDKLSTQSYWDDVLKDAKLPRLNSPKSYLYGVTMNFVDKYIQSKAYSSFFEVGCGSSGWLPYFAQKYNLKVSGLDYSEIGCQLAEKNLQLLNVNYGEILCRDFFQQDPTDGRKYDIVFSYGVIEHFDNPTKVIEIFSNFVNDNGIIITLVPNMAGLVGKLTRYFIRDVYDIHNVIDEVMLKNLHKLNGLEILENSYAGMFTTAVMPLAKSEKWLLKKGTLRRKFIFLSLKIADKFIAVVFSRLPLRVSSKFLSPYVICVARKNIL